MINKLKTSRNYSQSIILLAEHDNKNAFNKAIKRLKQFGFGDLSEKRILDLGCGIRYPFALQCAAEGARVTALDIEYVKPDKIPLAFLRIMKHDGMKRAISIIYFRIFYEKMYFTALEKCYKKPLLSHLSNIKFVTSEQESEKYPLSDESFDLIASNVVLEHVSDMEKFVSEVERLLVTGGYFYAIIHNFYSLSGAHRVEWNNPNEQPSIDVPPWDHLRENQFPPLIYLNRLEPEQYINEFSKKFQIIYFEGLGKTHDTNQPEGENFLTPEIYAELSSYSKELLLTRLWCMICKKS